MTSAIPDRTAKPIAAFASGHYGPDGGDGVKLTAYENLSLAIIDVMGGKYSVLNSGVEKEFGAALPQQPGCSKQSKIAFVWSGPNRWLAIGGEDCGLLMRLQASVAEHGCVTDVTGSRRIVRVSGARSRDALRKMIPIDLDEVAFTVGHSAMTVAAHIPVHLWQTDANAYFVACPRSFGVSLVHSIVTSAVEYGCDVDVARGFDIP